METTNPPLCFLDTETTSLDRHTRRAWDIAIIRRQPDGREIERQWFIDLDYLDLATANPRSLEIGRFYDRHPSYATNNPFAGEDESEVADNVERMTRGAILVGAVPSFDEETLDAMLRRHGLCPAWHYHLIDVETLAAGALRMAPPWTYDSILAAYGLAYKEEDRHTALGDARMVRDLYDKVLNTVGTAKLTGLTSSAA